MGYPLLKMSNNWALSVMYPLLLQTGLRNRKTPRRYQGYNTREGYPLGPSYTPLTPSLIQTTMPSRPSKDKRRKTSEEAPGLPAQPHERLDTAELALHLTPREHVLDLLDQAARINLENTKSTHTRRAYGRHWRDFELWCQQLGLQEMPATATDIVRYLNHLELQGRSIATIRLARSALVHAFRLRGMRDHENPGRDGVVTETLKGMSTRSRPQRQAAALLPEALNAIRATAMIPRERSNGGRPETRERAMVRGKVDIAMCLLLRDAGLRRSEAAALTWEDIETWPDGSGRLNIAKSKTNRTGDPEVVAITPAAMAVLEAIRPEETATGQSVFGLSERQISRRIRDAAKNRWPWGRLQRTLWPGGACPHDDRQRSAHQCHHEAGQVAEG